MTHLIAYEISDFYENQGKAQSFSLPDNCRKIIGIHFLSQWQDMPCPDSKAFVAFNASVLINNKQDNTIHDYPILCYPGGSGKMSNGREYSLVKNAIELNTETKKGYVLSIIIKDSGHMIPFVNTQPGIYGNYNPKLYMYVIYNDEHGDWSNDAVKHVRLVAQKSKVETPFILKK